MKTIILGLICVLGMGINAGNAHAFGGGSGAVEDATQFVHDARDFYNSATNYYYGNTHIHLTPSLSNPTVTVTYTFKSAPIKVTLIQIETKKVLGTRMIPSQQAVFHSVDQLLADKRISDKVKSQIRGEIVPLLDRTMAEAKKMASAIQEEVKAKKLTQAAGNAQFKERFQALISKAVATYPNVIIR